jgi:lysophospholipase L1-like esterase
MKLRLTLISLSLLVTLLLMEVICRIIPLSNDSNPVYKLAHPILPYSMKPNSESTSLLGIPVKINSNGLRDFEYSYNKPEDVFRILVLGDSIEYAYGEKMENGYTKILERRLNALENKKYKVIEVINTGHTSFGLPDTFNYLRLNGIKYSPDLLMVGLSSSNFREQSYELKIKDGIDYRVGSITENFPPWMKRNLRKSHLYFAIGWWTRAIRVSLRKQPEPLESTLKKNKAREPRNSYLDKLVLFASKEKIPVYVTFIPVREETIFQTYPQMELFRQINDLQISNKIEFIDLREYFHKFSNRTDEIFLNRDPAHLNSKGHEITADQLFYKLAPQVQYN